MLRRNFLASAAALLTLPAAKMTERLLGPKVVRTSEMRIGKPVHNAHVVIDGDMEGLILQKCSFEFAVRAPVWRMSRCVLHECEFINTKHYSGMAVITGNYICHPRQQRDIAGLLKSCVAA